MAQVRALVVGQSGTGKTTYARRLVRAALAAGRTVQVWTDDRRDWSELELPVLRVAGGDAGRDFAALTGSWVLEVADVTSREHPRLMEAMAAGVWQRGRMLLVLDEAHRWFPRYRAASSLERIVTGGRHRGLDWVMVTQHPVYVNLLVEREAEWLVSFRLTEWNDLERVRRLGMDSERVSRLPNYRALGLYLPARRFFFVVTR